jgi:hypothetical protein
VIRKAFKAFVHLKNPPIQFVMAFVVFDTAALVSAWYNFEVRQSIIQYNSPDYIDALDNIVESSEWDVLDDLLFSQAGLVITCGLISACMLQEPVAVMAYPRCSVGTITNRIILKGCLVGRWPCDNDIIVAYRAVWRTRKGREIVPQLPGFRTAWSTEETYRLRRMLPDPEYETVVKQVLDKSAISFRRRRVRTQRVERIIDRINLQRERSRAAIVIQRAWLRILYNPRTHIGRRRLERQFRELIQVTDY